MKWIIGMAVIAGLLWLGGDRVNELLASGRESAGSLTAPIHGLAKTVDQTRERVDETNRKIEALSGQAATASAGSAASAYGAQARRDLDALTR
ncbi:MAG: hypothetical protein P8R42_02885 [Candidatus Binatia bacterium]|nr:hypothetical protein [Candidatus Binatia bacterium]